MAQIDALNAVVRQVEQQTDEVLRPFREAADRLTTMPGVSETLARVIVAYLADRDKHRVTQNLLRRLRDLGVDVEVKVA